MKCVGRGWRGEEGSVKDKKEDVGRGRIGRRGGGKMIE